MAREIRVQSQVASYQKLKKMVLDASLLNTQHCKLHIKDKVEQSGGTSIALPGVVGIEKGAFGSPSTTVANFSYFVYIYIYIYLIYIYIYIYIYHVVPLARISLTFSRHFSLSSIASGRSSGLHPISSQSCCMYVRAGRPAFGWPYAGVHRSTSLISSSLLLQQCPSCLVRLTWIVFVMGGRWPHIIKIMIISIHKNNVNQFFWE